MENNLPRITAGFPEMWQPVHDKYRLFFEAAALMQPFVNEMSAQTMPSESASIVCRMVCAAANSVGAMLTLVLNGYGQDAVKIARGIYEAEINILWLKKKHWQQQLEKDGIAPALMRNQPGRSVGPTPIHNAA